MDVSGMKSNDILDFFFLQATDFVSQKVLFTVLM